MKKNGVQIAPFVSGLAMGLAFGVVISFALSARRELSIPNLIGTKVTATETHPPEAVTLLSTNIDLESPDRTGGSDQVSSRSGEDSRFLPTIAPLREAMMIPSMKGRLAFFARLQNLDPEEAPQMLAVFSELAQNGYKVREYEPFFWERWAELDGENVAAVIFERDKRFKETNLSKLTIATWAKNDPEAAMNWLFEQEDIPLREGMTKGLVEGMAAADPDLAMEFLRSDRLNSSQITDGFNQIARQKLIQGGIGSVGQWYSGISEDDPFFSVATNAAVQVYGKASFDDALNWANELEGSSHSVNQARNLLHARLSSGRPDGLIQFLSSAPDASEIIGVEALASRAVDRWLRTTPYAMGRWLQENQDSPNYDMIVEPYINNIAVDDLEAAKAWTETIREPKTRRQILERMRSNP